MYMWGDPVSPVLFDSALESLMGRLRHKWADKATAGLSINQRKLTNLRFADDLLLFATSLDGAQTMLKDLVQEAAKFGLEVHSSKTKLTWNGFGEGTRQTCTEVLGQTCEIVIHYRKGCGCSRQSSSPLSLMAASVGR